MVIDVGKAISESFALSMISILADDSYRKVEYLRYRNDPKIEVIIVIKKNGQKDKYL